MNTVKIGSVCPYCLTETEDVCCGEMHHEMGYLKDDMVYLESEIEQEDI